MVPSIIGMDIMPHAFPSVNRVLLSMLRKVIEACVKIFSSVVNHPYHMLLFLRGTVILFIPRKGNAYNASK